eukprot:g17395.t1
MANPSSLRTLGQFSVADPPKLDCGRKPEHLAETHADTGRTCKLNTGGRPRLELTPDLWCYEAAVLATVPPITLAPTALLDLHIPVESLTEAFKRALDGYLDTSGVQSYGQQSGDWHKAVELMLVKPQSARPTAFLQFLTPAE